jgi:hypothetical protein
MRYRGWTITAHHTFLGFCAQYISPMGLARQAGGSFTTDRQAIAYAQTLVDHLLRCERLGCPDDAETALAG